jgi:hypothetical protein
MSLAPVHNGLAGGGAAIASDYYRFGQRETVGPGQIDTQATTQAFTTLEELLDHMIASAETTHVIVNHGNPSQGLLIRFTATSPHNATGPVAAALGDLVVHGIPPNPFDPRLANLAAQMGVDVFAVLQLLGKLSQVAQRNPLLHFRGCNLGGDTTMLQGYKLAFGAALITAPNCRMFYLRLRPRRTPSGTTIAQLAGQAPTTPNTRRRRFPAPSGSSVGPLLADVRDIDGHTQVESPLSVLDDPAEAPTWGELLVGRWTGTAREFVLPVLWNNSETGFHSPLEVGYRERLTVV